MTKAAFIQPMHLYTPILLSKEGELVALANLDHVHKTHVIPLIQFIKDTNQDRVGNYIDTRIEPLIKKWNFLDNRIYIDVSKLGEGSAFIEEIYSKLATARLNVIPVLDGQTAPSLLNGIKNYLLHGVCLRFRGDTLSSESIEKEISYCVNQLSIELHEIDLMLDFGFVGQNNARLYLNAFDSIYSKLINGKKARKIIIGAGSFPQDLGAFAKDTVSSIPRTEWEIWKLIKAATPDAPLVYADYGNAHPVYNPDLAMYAGTCSIKYTDTDNYYIFKGEQAKKSKISTGQYQVKAVDLVKRHFYAGASFSWGDYQIMARAEEEETPGGSTTWVKITQNHHMTKIISLLRP